MSFVAIYNILIEAYIIFIIFAIFFFILIRYILTPFEIKTAAGFAVQQLNLYGLDQLKLVPGYAEHIESIKQNAIASNEDRQNEVNQYNETYQRYQIIVLVAMTFGLGVILVIPILLGFVKLIDLDWNAYLHIAIINLIIIVAVEYIFIEYVIGRYTPIRFYPAVGDVTH